MSIFFAMNANQSQSMVGLRVRCRIDRHDQSDDHIVFRVDSLPWQH